MSRPQKLLTTYFVSSYTWLMNLPLINKSNVSKTFPYDFVIK